MLTRVRCTGGGIPDLVTHGENGLLVPPQDVEALAGALVRVLSDRELAERLGEASHKAVEPWLAGPDLVERVASARPRTRRRRLVARGRRTSTAPTPRRG